MEAVVADVIAIIEEGRRTAINAVNTSMVGAAYWPTGKRIAEEELINPTRFKTQNHEVHLHSITGGCGERMQETGNGKPQGLSKDKFYDVINPMVTIATNSGFGILG